MSNQSEIVLREDGEDNPPGILEKIKDIVNHVSPEIGVAAASFIRGKGGQETAKTMDIKASAIEKISHAENERQRLINERLAHRREMERLKKRDGMEHEARMRALDIEEEKVKIARTRMLIEQAKVLREMDCDLKVNVQKLFEA